MDKSPNIVANIENSIVKKSYVTLGMDNMISMTADNDTYYYHADARSSVKALSDSAGNAVANYAYTAFGEAVATSCPKSLVPSNSAIAAQRYCYTGREFNPHSGNYYFRYRTYNPSIGSFTSRDPLGYVDGLSQYNGYFAAVLGMDPDGREKKECCGPKEYDPKTYCCYNNHPYRRLYTDDQCRENFDKQMQSVLNYLKEIGVANAIGEAAWTTLVGTLLGYGSGGAIGGAKGGPVGATIGGAIFTIAGIVDIGISLDVADQLKNNVIETYDRCMACQK